MSSASAGALETASAADWYRHERVGDGVIHVFEHHIYPFYRCNIWHVRGREYDLLVDSGLGVVNLLAQLPWLQAERIVALASHAHFDHIGGHHLFSRRACHALEAATLAAPTAHETLADRYATLSMFSKLPPGGFRSEDYHVQAAPATRLLEHGDVVDLGDRHFEILHVPGHSPGSIALWEARTGVLFSGDCVYDGPLVDDAHHSDIRRYLESMRALRELPVTVVHGGHFPSFGRERFKALIDSYCAAKRAPSA
jgi:glyoxylase-like metal-dependent hydrolase (beta-lactamase superfamily II)